MAKIQRICNLRINRLFVLADLCRNPPRKFGGFSTLLVFTLLPLFSESPSDLPRVHEIKIETENSSMSKSEPSLNTAAAADDSDKNGSGGSPPIPLKRPPADKRRKKSSKGSEDGSGNGGSGKEVQMLLRR